jgi:hypothetical protein
MAEQRDEVWAKWRAVITEQRGSGQTVAAFCRERSVREWQFFAWKKRLSQAETRQLVEVQVVGGRPVPLPAAPGPAIEIRLEGGRRVFVEPGFDADHLRVIIAALETGV